jgi:hypothetical protein
LKLLDIPTLTTRYGWNYNTQCALADRFVVFFIDAATITFPFYWPSENKCYLHDLVVIDGVGVVHANGAHEDTEGCYSNNHIIPFDQIDVYIHSQPIVTTPIFDRSAEEPVYSQAFSLSLLQGLYQRNNPTTDLSLLAVKHPRIKTAITQFGGYWQLAPPTTLSLNKYLQGQEPRLIHKRQRVNPPSRRTSDTAVIQYDNNTDNSIRTNNRVASKYVEMDTSTNDSGYDESEYDDVEPDTQYIGGLYTAEFHTSGTIGCIALKTHNVHFISKGRIYITTDAAKEMVVKARTVYLQDKRHILFDRCKTVDNNPIINANLSHMFTLPEPDSNTSNVGMPPCVHSAIVGAQLQDAVRWQFAETVAEFIAATDFESRDIIETICKAIQTRKYNKQSEYRIDEFKTNINAKIKTRQTKRIENTLCIYRGKNKYTGLKCPYGGFPKGVAKCCKAQGIPDIDPASAKPSTIWAMSSKTWGGVS